MNLHLFAVYFLLMSRVTWAENRIWIDLTIRDQRMHLAFDTGASSSVLFRSAAERLQAELVDPSDSKARIPGSGVSTITELCEFPFVQLKARIQFLVMDLPSFAETESDGVMSWRPFRKNVFVLSTNAFEITNEVPLWTSVDKEFKAKTDQAMLGFDARVDDPEHCIVYVDSGDEGGVALNHVLWKRWAAKREKAPATLVSLATLKSGPLLKEEIWADAITIGSLALTDVPVRESDAKEEIALDHYAATLGLYALRRLCFVFDGQHGIVYTRPTSLPPPVYTHNHLGAVFEPNDDTHDMLVAHVAPHSPADRAGIQDGDILLKVNETDVTKWRSNPLIIPRQYWERAPGTIYLLTLKRGKSEYQTEVTLQSILPPINALK